MFRTAEEAFQFFAAGEWAFTRSLSYRLGGGVGTVAGRAQWKPWPYPVAAGSVTSIDATPLPDRDHLLLYDEEGQLELQGVQQPLRVTRQYAFNCAKLPVEVFFIGGDLGSGGSSVVPGEIPSISYMFHALEFKADGDEGERSATATFSHSCVDDLYEGSLVVKSAVEFEWSWRVTGPEKDGTINTRYVRR